MSERPILFIAPMVRAILREIDTPGTGKTQTRRVLKPQPQGISAARRVRNVCYQITPESDRCTVDFKAPIFAPGDRLWVRETWTTANSAVGPGVGYRADSGFIQPEYDGPDFGAGPSYDYDKYPGDYSMWYEDLLSGAPGHGWKPGIHMPRWASRLTLHVTDVRVQRLQDISEDDAVAEGIEAREIRAVPERWGVPPETWWFGTEAGRRTAKAAFGDLWDSLNAERAPWTRNPWVVAVTFRPELCNIDSAYGAVAKREATN